MFVEQPLTDSDEGQLMSDLIQLCHLVCRGLEGWTQLLRHCTLYTTVQCSVVHCSMLRGGGQNIIETSSFRSLIRSWLSDLMANIRYKKKKFSLN